jgi:vancomycin resistance protein YoaR
VKKGLKIILPLVILAAVFVPLGVILQETASVDNQIYQGVYINGLNVGGMTKEEAAKTLNETLNTKVENKKLNIKYEDKVFTIDYKSLKAHYDIDKAVNEALAYGKSGNIFVKSINRMKLKNGRHDIKLDFHADTSTVNADIKNIAKKINKEPVNAKIVIRGGAFSITPDVKGIKVNEAKLKELIDEAVKPYGDEETIEVPVEIVEAKIKADMLSKINSKLSSFSTAFKLSDVNRSGNIRIAAKALDGTIVLPGEIFSMNKTLGPRVASKGYKEAPVIINGELTPGLAGGICQVSSTLYNSVLLANLDIVERRPHGLKVGYVDAGRDATISGNAIDLKFKNTTNAPIYIQAVVSGATITVNLYGAKEGPTRVVKIISEIYERIEPKIEYIKDPTLPEGKKVVEVKPIQGIKSRTYRKVYENGKLVKTELISKDFYKPADGKIRIGTKNVGNSGSTLPAVNINESQVQTDTIEHIETD